MVVVEGKEEGEGWLWEGDDEGVVKVSTYNGGSGMEEEEGGVVVPPPPPNQDKEVKIKEDDDSDVMDVDTADSAPTDTVTTATTATLPLCRRLSLWGLTAVLVQQVERSSSSRDYQRSALRCIAQLATSRTSSSTVWWEVASPLLMNLAGINSSNDGSSTIGKEVVAVIKASAIETLGSIFPRQPPPPPPPPQPSNVTTSGTTTASDAQVLLSPLKYSYFPFDLHDSTNYHLRLLTQSKIDPTATAAAEILQIEAVVRCQRDALAVLLPFLLARLDLREVWTLRLASLVSLKHIMASIYIAPPTPTPSSSGGSTARVSLLTSSIIEQLLGGE